MRTTGLESTSYQIRPVFNMSGDLQKEFNELTNLEEQGWLMLSDGTPVQFDFYAEMTVDPTEQWGDNFENRTTLMGEFEQDGLKIEQP